MIDRGGEQKMLFLRVNLTSKLEDINAGFKKIMASAIVESQAPWNCRKYLKKSIKSLPISNGKLIDLRKMLKK